ncbi:MAG: molybdopterin-dependent oxidoreductase [Coriobacteriales bacterium]|jgi:anaerobic dimethyl sulfoxide reductase subunit A|nr:molybdopterin-dependent oxidoreductase [Coriobacteriales bacterium]
MSILEHIEKQPLNRRHFVALAATAGVTGALGLTGCDNKVTELTEEQAADYAANEAGEWRTIDCPQSGCQWRCFNRAYVVDGIIIRQGIGSTGLDSEDNPQQRTCPRGRSIRRMVTGAERLKYPMKRKNWQPGGGENINGHLRGIDEWERISWDEAVTYMADEFTRIRDTYGNRAFLATGQDDDKLGKGKFGSQILNLMGGALTTWGQQSEGGAAVPSFKMRGCWGEGEEEAQDRMAIRHTKLIVLWGYNPAWNAGTGDMYFHLVAKQKSGAKVILIDPYFNPTAQALVDQWIPIHPSTDGALMEAVCYEIVNNGWQDQDFLDRCCVGFDAEHMPADAKTNENFRDHLLGVYDGQPKTAEWASPICGVPVAVIKELAREMGTTKPMTLKAALAIARSYYGNRVTQLFYTMGWICGAEGQLGAETSMGRSPHFGTKDGEFLVKRGKSSYEFPPNPICTEPRADGLLTEGNADEYDHNLEYGICFAEFHKAIVTGEYTLPGPANAKRACDIKCLYRENARNPSNQQTGGYYQAEAYRKLEFVVVQDMYMKTDALYADIVLPVKSFLELDFSYNKKCMPEFTLVAQKVIEPYYESKEDLEIFYLLCDKLGFGEDVAPRTTAKQLQFEMLASATVIMEDGENREPLVAITDDDLEYYGVSGEPQEGRVPLRTFFEENGGVYQVQRSDDDNFKQIFHQRFREDPEGNPIDTTSGKNEIYCQALKDFYDLAGMHDIDALPKYKAAVDGFEQLRQDPEYPFQLITLHHLRQIHSNFANVKQLNEVFPNDLLMSTPDAERLGLAKGDWVLASCAEGGQMARRLNVIPNLVPGTVVIGEGNWRKVDEATGIDIGGNPNSVTRVQYLGDGYQAYNTVLLKIEPYQGTAPEPDYRIANYVPIA